MLSQWKEATSTNTNTAATTAAAAATAQATATAVAAGYPVAACLQAYVLCRNIQQVMKLFPSSRVELVVDQVPTCDSRL